MIERSKEQILRELVEQADEKYLYGMVCADNRPATVKKRNAEAVGELVLGLPQEDRDKLKDLTTEDIGQHFAAYRRARPQFPTHRVRGAVTHTKGNKDEQ